MFKLDHRSSSSVKLNRINLYGLSSDGGSACMQLIEEDGIVRFHIFANRGKATYGVDSGIFGKVETDYQTMTRKFNFTPKCEQTLFSGFFDSNYFVINCRLLIQGERVYFKIPVKQLENALGALNLTVDKPPYVELPAKAENGFIRVYRHYTAIYDDKGIRQGALSNWFIINETGSVRLLIDDLFIVRVDDEIMFNGAFYDFKSITDAIDQLIAKEIERNIH